MADMTGTMRPKYLVLLDAGELPLVRSVGGNGLATVKLAVSIRYAPNKYAPTADIESGAALELDMRWEEMVSIYAHIQQFAQREGLSLPKEGADLE